MNPAVPVCRLLLRLSAQLLMGWLCGCAALWSLPAWASGEAGSLVSAQRQIDLGAWQQKALPDWPLDPPVSPPPARVRYRVSLPPNAAPADDAGLLIPGLLLNGSISFNGHLLQAAVDPEGRALPRGLDRLAVLSLPAALWQPEGNTIEIDALAQNRMSLARLEVGSLGTLLQKHRRLVLTRYVSPLVAGGVVGSLGLAMLALWWRLREPSFVLFAVGALAWWLVNWMPLFAWPPIGGVAYAITWISLFGVVVAAFAAFCLRLANWRSPGLERWLLLLAVTGPLLLAGAYALGQLDLASSAWRLLLIGGIAIAFAAVSRAYVQTRSRASLAMVACGGLALLLGALDWLSDLDDTSNHPLLLTTYAGLAFAGTAAALLVVRYVEAAKTSAALRSGLEERVRAQGAQLRTALKDMETARDLARAADRAKSSFLAVASHDLRQPAHAIGLYLEAMPAEGLGEEQSEVLERLRESHRALESMFDALLDMSQIDAGTLTPQPRALSPWALLQRLADEAAPAAEGKGLRLALRAGQGAAEAQVHTDALLLERMLRNLIGNAVKYTQTGAVLLACRLRSRGGARCLRLEVWDSGSGIAAADADRVFEEFYRVYPGRSATDGLGLGLPIVKRLAQLLGVRIGFRSRLGHGSCFSLELPLAVPRAQAQYTEAAPVRAVFQGLRVGVLEDDAPVRDAMARVLRRWGCRVYTGADAAQLAAAAGPEAGSLQLLVVDYALAAGATGPGEARAYTAAHGASAKVLVVTGEQTPERLQDLAALRLPWLPKPASTEALRRGIAELMAPVAAPGGHSHE